MTAEYLHRDDCYSDDGWIAYTCYCEDGGTVFIVAERRKDMTLPMRHILIVETRADLKGHGIGKRCLADYLSSSDAWSLCPIPSAVGFYHKLGFKDSDYDDELLVLGHDLRD